MEMTLVPTGFYELPIFKTLTTDEVDEIGRLAHPMTFQAGEVIFEEKSLANCLDIVWEGDVTISKRDPEGENRPIAIIHAKSVVGEMSLMSGLGRSCSGVATTDVKLFRIRRDDFVGLLDRGSLAAYKVIYNLAQVMSGRLRAVDEKLVDLLNQREDAEQEQTEEFSDFRKKLFTEWTF
jgi:CRP/FNR family transcriptional regulator, cyclic AMP receptor protein